MEGQARMMRGGPPAASQPVEDTSRELCKRMAGCLALADHALSIASGIDGALTGSGSNQDKAPPPPTVPIFPAVNELEEKLNVLCMALETTMKRF